MQRIEFSSTAVGVVLCLLLCAQVSLAERPSPTPIPAKTTETPPDRMQASNLTDDSIRIVDQRAGELISNGFDLTKRGAIYAAQNEFVRALEMIGHTRDGLTRTTRYHDAIVRGLTALEEVDDFVLTTSSLASNDTLKDIVATHETPVLKQVTAEVLTPVLATRRYCAYAQAMLLEGCSGIRVSSEALYGLGRTEMVRAQMPVHEQTVGAPKAMVLFETAVRLDPNNYEACNELGVLFAEYGQHARARDLLLQSVRSKETPEAWFNLAQVGARVGDRELEDLSRARYRATSNTSNVDVGHPGFRWVDRQQFQSNSPPDYLLAQGVKTTTTNPPQAELPVTSKGVAEEVDNAPTGRKTGVRALPQKLKSLWGRSQ